MNYKNLDLIELANNGNYTQVKKMFYEVNSNPLIENSLIEKALTELLLQLDEQNVRHNKGFYDGGGRRSDLDDLYTAARYNQKQYEKILNSLADDANERTK
jgi:hypothetical protein